MMPFAFAVHARVAKRHRPDRVGTVVEQRRHSNGSPRYVVAWDYDPEGRFLVWQADLMKAVESSEPIAPNTR